MELPKGVLKPDQATQPKVEQRSADPPRIDPPNAGPAKLDAPKIDPPSVGPIKADPPKVDPPRLDPSRIDPPKMEQPNVDQPKQPKPEFPTSAQTPQAASAQAMLASPTTQNAIKLAGEALMPGASLLMDGKIVHGGAHLLAGAVAKAFLGPVGIAVVIANSYSNSTTGKNLLEQLQRFMPPKTE